MSGDEITSLRSVPTETLRRTPLYEAHQEAGAKLVPFAGWEMPVSYDGIREEHVAVRTHAGMFDVSHMGQVETEGPEALDFLQRVLSNDLSALAVGGAQYSVLCNEQGGVIDDLFTYRLAPEHFITVTNAANHAADLRWMARWVHDYDCVLRDVADRWAMIAVQGPNARRIAGSVLRSELPPRMRVTPAAVEGAPALICGTGYTGEDGVEVLLAAGRAPAAWKHLLDAGVVPCGLGARDTLRLEVCFHLYGNDLTEERGPIEAGLGWCCKEDTGFIGADAVRATREGGPAETLVPFVMTGPGIARQGNQVSGGGEVTSGTMSPCLGQGIGMAYVPTGKAEPGTTIEIDVRGRARQAEVRAKPLYSKER